MFSANLVIISVFRNEIFARVNKEVLTFYDRSFVSSISLFQGRRCQPPYP
jgi:hypothetical protein